MSASALVDDLALSLYGNTAREPCEAHALVVRGCLGYQNAQKVVYT